VLYTLLKKAIFTALSSIVLCITGFSLHSDLTATPLIDKLSVSEAVIIGDGLDKYLTRYLEIVYFDIISAILSPASNLNALLLFALLKGFLFYL